jgi:phage gp36-like protein
LFSCELLHTSAKDIFKAINKFFTEHAIRSEKCVGITTDGAAAMSGYKTELLVRVKEVAPQVKWTHCCIHREALVAKRLSEHMITTLEEVVKIINFIKSRSLQFRIFEVLAKTWEVTTYSLFCTLKFEGFHVGKFFSVFLS